MFCDLDHFKQVNDRYGHQAGDAVLQAMASEPVPLPQGEVQITMSVGVALASPDESLDDLIARADAAMYAAKHQGRDQVDASTLETATSLDVLLI